MAIQLRLLRGGRQAGPEAQRSLRWRGPAEPSPRSSLLRHLLQHQLLDLGLRDDLEHVAGPDVAEEGVAGPDAPHRISLTFRSIVPGFEDSFAAAAAAPAPAPRAGGGGGGGGGGRMPDCTS